ncbi:MAG: complex I subunit 4 family protein [Acidimicrobiales bacterium]
MSGAFPYLTVLVLLPAGAALVVALVPRVSGRLFQLLGLVASLATLGVASAMTAAFRVGVSGFQMTSDHSWIGQFGISWHLGVDGISLFLALLTALLFPLALAGAHERRDPKGYVAWMLLLEAACLGSFLALDIFVFFLFFEITLVPAYFIIGGWGFERRGPAAVKFFLYTFLGSAFLLIGILAVAFLHQRATGQLTFDLVSLARHPGISGAAGIALFLAFTAAFAVKAPVFPFHTWSPDAYAESPTGGVVVIAGVMAKLGSYGIIRFDFELFPKATLTLSPLLLTLAVIGILYGAVVAAHQRDLKRMLAYSSLSNLGFIVLGFFALTSQGITGGVLQMSNHGLYTAALFLVIGMLYRRRRTWQAGELHGLQRSVPILAGIFTVAMLASIGLPGLNGFVGEFLILLGTFATHRWWAVAATVGVILAALYLLWAYQRVFHGRAEGPNVAVADLSWREGAVLAPLVVLIVFIGVYPRPVLERITPSVQSLVAHVEHTTAYTPPLVTTARSGVALGGK